MSPETWTPPENPDPSAILDEARDDARAKRYALSLAKHVWFFEHALEFDEAQYGVRLSFALLYWRELATEYPPALEKLRELRDAATHRVLSGTDEEEADASFDDMEAINRELGERHKTAELFMKVHEEHPAIAKTVFSSAQSALIEAGLFNIIAQYVSPREDFADMRLSFTSKREMNLGDEFHDSTYRMFVHESTTLVAILAVTGQQAEAEHIAAQARLEWDDVSFHKALDDALNGVVPEPWP